MASPHLFTHSHARRLLESVRRMKAFPQGSKGEALAARLAGEITKDFHTFRALQRLTAEERNVDKLRLHGRNYGAGEHLSMRLRFDDLYGASGQGKSWLVPSYIEQIHHGAASPRTLGEIPMTEDRNSASPDPNADLIVPEKLPKEFKTWKELAQSMSDAARLARRDAAQQREIMNNERTVYRQQVGAMSKETQGLVADVEQLTKTIHLLSR